MDNWVDIRVVSNREQQNMNGIQKLKSRRRSSASNDSFQMEQSMESKRYFQKAMLVKMCLVEDNLADMKALERLV